MFLLGVLPFVLVQFKSSKLSCTNELHSCSKEQLISSSECLTEIIALCFSQMNVHVLYYLLLVMQ